MNSGNKELGEAIGIIMGDDIPPLINLLKDKKSISEFRLAERLNLTVNQVRNMLYRLYKHNLVSFSRKKDQKKGWYIYYWTINSRNMEETIFQHKQKKLEEFKERLEKEKEGAFFVCPNACMRLKFENAMEYEFKCQECGQLMQQQDNTKTVNNIKAKIRELEEELQEEAKKREETAKKHFAALIRRKKRKIKKPKKAIPTKPKKVIPAKPKKSAHVKPKKAVPPKKKPKAPKEKKLKSALKIWAKKALRFTKKKRR